MDAYVALSWRKWFVFGVYFELMKLGREQFGTCLSNNKLIQPKILALDNVWGHRGRDA